jgi:triacylglycerol lipase
MRGMVSGAHDSTYPIVLAHGIARFDALVRVVVPSGSPFADETHYFRRIQSTLAGHGFDARHSAVPWAGSVGSRAAALWRQIRALDAPKVHIVAHSMGGLDARHMLYDFRDEGAALRVASLTTIGTPHLGTSFADWGLEHGDELLGLLNALGIGCLDGFRDLATATCERFDAHVRGFEESSGVLFQTWSGTQSFLRTFAPLKFAWLVISERDRARDGGANDGLVPLYSARWRADYYRGDLDADHLNQIGWCDPDELAHVFFPSPQRDAQMRLAVEQQARDVYVAIAKELAVGFPWKR